MSDHWRDTYDAWKTATPDDYDGPLCDKCGEFLRRDPISGFYCEACDEAEPTEHKP